MGAVFLRDRRHLRENVTPERADDDYRYLVDLIKSPSRSRGTGSS